MGRFSLANWKKTIYYLQRNGLRNTIYAALERLGGTGETYCYEEPEQEELRKQRGRSWENAPLFSILVPTWRTPEAYLKELLDSVLNQTYERLELVIADATEDDSVERVVRGRMEQEKSGRLRYHRLPHNGGISENSNQALPLTRGDYVGLLDHDDVLTPDALYRMAEAVEKASAEGFRPLLLYSDEDKCNQNRTEYYEPHRKPDFNLDLLLSNNYICHFLVMERNLIQDLGFRKEYDGAQDYDLVLRAVSRILQEAGGEKRIAHIPRILYHWRCHTGSTAENPQSKQYAYEAGKRALQDMADRMGWKARAVHLKHLGFYGLHYEPELLEVRKDVGAVGGRLLSNGRVPGQGGILCHGRIPCRGRIVSGAYDEDGNVLYQGLKNGYSGYMHRGVLVQDVAAADLRLIRVSPRCRELFGRVTGVPYVEKNGSFDWTTLPKEADIRQMSLKLGEALREEGYRICWDPEWSGRLPADAAGEGDKA